MNCTTVTSKSIPFVIPAIPKAIGSRESFRNNPLAPLMKCFLLGPHAKLWSAENLSFIRIHHYLPERHFCMFINKFELERRNQIMQYESTPAKGWWYARFRMKWPDDMEPSWHIDLLIAHRIVAPVLYRYDRDIALWRFHRRAARDAEGHQFSLTFYSSPEFADQIFDALRSDPLLKRMKRAGLIIQDLYEDTGKITTPNIEDTSDGNWAAPVRKSWPLFIMGVCRMWLSLIDEIKKSKSQKQGYSSLKKMLLFYREVNEDIRTLWRDQGSHSLLHHLNAIFGYEPVLVHEVQLRRF